MDHKLEQTENELVFYDWGETTTKIEIHKLVRQEAQFFMPEVLGDQSLEGIENDRVLGVKKLIEPNTIIGLSPQEV